MQKFSGIKHIVFDLDHTLWDFERNSELAYAQIFTEKEIDLSIERFVAVYKPINLRMWKRFRESEITQTQLRYDRLKMAFDACGYKPKRELINQISELYLDYLPNHNHLFPGTKETLDKLSKDYQLHILTNGFNVVQAKKLANSGIGSYFDVVLTAEEAGYKKPDKRIFEILLDKIGATPEESLMVGDNLEADIQGAQAVAMPALWFSDNEEEELYPRITTLSEIFDRLN